jgi:hypothetical protein
MVLKDKDPIPYSEEEKEYTEYLIKKYGFRLGTKKEKYRIYK